MSLDQSRLFVSLQIWLILNDKKETRINNVHFFLCHRIDEDPICTRIPTIIYSNSLLNFIPDTPFFIHINIPSSLLSSSSICKSFVLFLLLRFVPLTQKCPGMPAASCAQARAWQSKTDGCQGGCQGRPLRVCVCAGSLVCVRYLKATLRRRTMASPAYAGVGLWHQAATQ